MLKLPPFSEVPPLPFTEEERARLPQPPKLDPICAVLYPRPPVRRRRRRARRLVH